MFVNKKFWLHVREVYLRITNWIYDIIKLLFNRLETAVTGPAG
jgi:hypothetical protein